MRSKGQVIGHGAYIYFYMAAKNFLSKYSLSGVYFNTYRLLIEFKGLWYSLAARQVFVAIANPVSLGTPEKWVSTWDSVTWGDTWCVLASHAKMGSRYTSEVGLHMR